MIKGVLHRLLEWLFGALDEGQAVGVLDTEPDPDDEPEPCSCPTVPGPVDDYCPVDDSYPVATGDIDVTLDVTGDVLSPTEPAPPGHYNTPDDPDTSSGSRRRP
jgi:hypothetical protein